MIIVFEVLIVVLLVCLLYSTVLFNIIAKPKGKKKVFEGHEQSENIYLTDNIIEQYKHIKVDVFLKNYALFIKKII